MDQAKGRRAFWFVLALVLVTALVMGGVLALNVIADPYGSVGTHYFPTVTTSDRTVKADKIEQLKEGPELVILGSSRSMRYEPEYLEEKTGLSTFNAGVNGIGGTADAWAMSQFIHDTWPDVGSRVPVAARRRVVRAVRGRRPHRQRAAHGPVRGPGVRRQGPA